MTYQDFQETILTHLRQKISPDTKVSIQSIRKNNGVILEGLTIMEADSNISPTIYLPSYYQAYQNGENLSSIIDRILTVYRDNRPNAPVDIRFYTDFENVRSRILFKLIHYEKNEALLCEVPHLKFLDLAIVFYCLVSVTPNGSATILIHNKHLNYWNVQVEDLYTFATENTPRLLPVSFCPLTDMIKELCDSADITEAENNCNMYVLTNEQKLYGAGVLLYPNILQQLAKRLECDLFILPSSVHEVLILPVTPDLSASSLDQMVQEVNRTQLDADEILSDHVYSYSRSLGVLS